MRKNRKTANETRQLILKWILLISSGILALLFLLFISVRIGVFGKIPAYAELKNVRNNMATEIISVDNQILGRYYYENRTNAKFSDLPQHLIDALIATEDIRFFKHNGVDFRSTMRVVIKSILLFDKRYGGGSTISQQLAKNLYPRKQYGLLTMPVVKFKEIIIAHRLEKIYSKQDILELYLNTVTFGENTYGIETAALIYFNKKPSELKIEESAVLIGLLKASNYYNPHKNTTASYNRRNIVLSQMSKYGYIEESAEDSIKNIPISLSYRKLTHDEGPAPYLREYLRTDLLNILEEIKKPDGTNYNLYADGLKVYTTINYVMQEYAESSVREHLSWLQQVFDQQWKGKEPWKKNISVTNQQITQSKVFKKQIAQGKSEKEAIEFMKQPHKTKVFSWDGDKDTLISSLDSVIYHFKMLQTGVLAMNGFSGDILVWVGGINYKYYQYDHVTAKRQVGSTFKPFVYTTALENGAKPCNVYENDSIVYTEYDDWTPQNSDGKYGGYYTMKGALAHSVNTVSAKIILETGIKKTINLAHSMGIQSELPEVPSLALGTGELSLLELVQAYCTFITKGKPIQPRIVRRIEDANGNVIFSDPVHAPGDSVISQQTAQTMIAMMQGTVDRGTASSLRTVYGLDNEIAGKTGTTQNQTDGWFVGLNPNMVMGVWVGGDNPVVRFPNITYGQGAVAALPVFAGFSQKLYNDPLYRYMKNASFGISQAVYDEFDCEDYSEDEIRNTIEIFNLKDTGVGEFIRRIFSRNRKKQNEEQDTINIR